MERLIGSVRREYLDHAPALGERHLPRRVLSTYASYYNQTRTRLVLAKDAPNGRPIKTRAGLRADVIEGSFYRYNTVCPHTSLGYRVMAL